MSAAAAELSVREPRAPTTLLEVELQSTASVLARTKIEFLTRHELTELVSMVSELRESKLTRKRVAELNRIIGKIAEAIHAREVPPEVARAQRKQLLLDKWSSMSAEEQDAVIARGPLGRRVRATFPRVVDATSQVADRAAEVGRRTGKEELVRRSLQVAIDVASAIRCG
jgi:hypothetical protein